VCLHELTGTDRCAQDLEASLLRRCVAPPDIGAEVADIVGSWRIAAAIHATFSEVGVDLRTSQKALGDNIERSPRPTPRGFDVDII